MLPVVIIAAGEGTRIEHIHDGIPKTLIEINGKPILEIIINNYIAIGSKKFYIITGYKNNILKNKVKELSIKKNVSIETIYNSEWKKSNGYSVLAAQKIGFETDFFLSMSDHLFSIDIIRNLFQFNNEFSTLAVDSKLSKIIDVDEATKLLIADGLPKKIGKDIDNYNAVDCGIFKFNNVIFEALKIQIKNDKDSLSDAVRYLIDNNKFQILEVPEMSYWIDVDTEKDLNIAQRFIEKGYI